MAARFCSSGGNWRKPAPPSAPFLPSRIDRHKAGATPRYAMFPSVGPRNESRACSEQSFRTYNGKHDRRENDRRDNDEKRNGLFKPSEAKCENSFEAGATRGKQHWISWSDVIILPVHDDEFG